MAQFYCTKCGTRVDDTVKFCPNCGEPLVSTVNNSETVQPTPQFSSTGTGSLNSNYGKPCPETHLTKAILLTIFCCWPLGIPAIVNASGVSNAYAVGNYTLAEEKSKNAAKWCNYCLIGGIAFWAIYIVIMVILVIVEASLY